MKTENESKFPIYRSLYAALAVILITIILSAALFWNIQAMVTQNCWELLENNAHAIKKEIESHMETDIEMLETQAKLLAQCSTDQEIQFYMKMQPHMLSNEYRLLLPDNSIITKNGIVPDSGLSFADEAAQGDHISDRTKEHDSDRWIVRNFVPVEKNGTTIGMLYGVIYLDTLSEHWDFIQYDGKCCVYIMDRRNGDFLLDTWHSDLKNIHDVKGRKAKRGYQYDTMQEDQMQGGSGRCVFESKSAGEDLYYYYEPLKINQWSMAVSAQESIAFQNAIAMKQRLLLFILLESLMLISYLLWTLFRVKTNDETHQIQIKKEKELSEFDPLTGVRNRRAFVNISNHYRTAKAPVGLALIDIDNFKQINDSFGHTGGDQALKYVAELLVNSIRPTDYVFRIGGDEFSILFPETDRNATEYVQGIFQELNETLSNENTGLPPITLSAGVAFSSKGYHDFLYSQADQALYTAKKTGRSDCKFYS